MTAAKTLLVFPASLHGGLWAARPRVKPELVSMYTILRRHGVETQVLDLENEVGNPGASDRDTFAANAQKLLTDVDSDLVVITCLSSLQYLASVGVAELVREMHPRTTLAVVGFHVSARPEDFTYEGSPFDWVVQGDPELPLVEISAEVARGGRPTRQRLVEGTTLPLTADTLPDYESYPYTRSGLHSLSVYLSRGCPYPTEACQLRPGAVGWRAYPPDVAADLLDRLAALRPGRIEVLDPAFGLDDAWRRAMWERLGRDLGREVELSITVRPEAFGRPDVDAAYRADVRLGIDVGTLSRRLLERTGAMPAAWHVEGSLDLMRYANAKGVPGEASFVFNQPGETRETANETLDALEAFVEEVPTSSMRLTAQSWIYYPYGDPKAEVDARRKRYGTRILHPEWWREGISSHRAAAAVVASADLADLEAGDESYWRPRFAAIAKSLAEKLTSSARRGVRSHEWGSTAATGVPHGFWVQPRWH